MNPLMLKQLVDSMMGNFVPPNRPMAMDDLYAFMKRDPRISQQYTPLQNAMDHRRWPSRETSFQDMRTDDKTADKIYFDHGRPGWSQWLRPPEEITPNERVRAGFSDFSRHYLWSGDNREAREKFDKELGRTPLPKPDPRGSTFTDRLPPAIRPQGYAGEIPAGLLMMMQGLPVRPDQDMVWDPEMLRNFIEVPKTKDRS